MNVPISRFDPENDDHMRLAKLARAAEDMAKPWRYDEKSGQIAISKRIGEALEKEEILKNINEIAHRLLPDQCDDQ